MTALEFVAMHLETEEDQDYDARANRIRRCRREAEVQHKKDAAFLESGLDGSWSAESSVRECPRELWSEIVLLTESRDERNRRKGLTSKNEKFHENWPCNPKKCPHIQALRL